MNKEIYYVKNGQRVGPVQLSDFIALNMPGSTLIWYQGLENWIPANQAPLTAGIYSNGGTPTIPNTPSYGNAQNNQEMPPKPDTYLVWAILTTIFCCLPFGIVSIVYSCKVDSLYYNGRYDESYKASQNAKNWAIWSAVGSLVISAIYILLVVFAGLAV